MCLYLWFSRRALAPDWLWPGAVIGLKPQSEMLGKALRVDAQIRHQVTCSIVFSAQGLNVVVEVVHGQGGQNASCHMFSMGSF